MAPRAFRIFRATNADGSLDPQAKFVFDPSIDSDELFDALRVEYPGIKTHAERKRQAVMDFLVREREDDLRALDMLVGDQVASPAVMTSAASNFTPAPSSAEPTPESNASPGQPSPIELPPSAMFKSSKSSSAFQVWDPSSNKPVKLHSRRRMTEQEKEEYRMRRLLGSCDSCKQKRRKCRHFLEASPPSKSRSRKAKASRAASSSNASPLINMHSASESGSDSSPTESLTQTFSHDMSAPPSAVFNNEDLFPISEIPFDQSFGSDFTLFSEGAADLDLLPMTDQPLFNTPPPLVNSPVAQYHLNNADWSFMNNNAGLFDANADWLNAPIDATFEDFSHAVSSDLHRIDSGGTQRHVLNQQFQAASTDWNSLLQEQISPAQSGLLARPQLESAEAVQASSAALGGLISTDRALQAQRQQQRENRSVVISGRLRSNQPGIQTDLHGSPVIGGYTDNDRSMMLDRASPGTFLSSASASPSTSQYSDVMDQGMLIDSRFYVKNLEASEPVPHVPRKRKQDQRQALEGSLQSSQSGGLQSIGGSSRFYSQEAPQLVRYGHASCTSTPDGEQRTSVGIESYGPASDSVIRQGLFPSRPGEQGSFSSSSSQTASSSTPASQASSPVLERAGVVLASSSLRQASSSPRAGDHASSSSDSSSNASTAVRYSPAPDNQVRWAATLQPGAASGGATHSLPPASNDAAVMLSSQTPLQSSPASAAPTRSNASSAAATAAILSPTELASGRQPAAASLQQMTSSPTNASQTLLSLSTSRDGNSQLSFSGPSWLAFAIFSLLLVSYVVVKLGFPVATASAVGIMMKQTVSQKVSSVVSHGLLLGLVAVGGDVFVGRTGCSRYT